MRVLLDEQLDWRLRSLFDADFTVVTMTDRGWASLPDGAMLRAAAAEFDALVTMDGGIPHQQNIGALALGVVLVRAVTNRRADVAPLIPLVNEALRRIRPGELVRVGVR
jgi:predicted nuclease of predicted toxin-antitoxin system